jgi:hypothetical protein
LRQDSLILATNNSSLTKDVLTKVFSYTTSREVWLALKRSFSFFSHVKTIQVHIQLANTKKGVMSAQSYFLHIKRLLDELALAGQPLTCDDIFTYFLASLSQEYDSLASMVSSCPDPITLEEFYYLLLLCESRVTHNNQLVTLVALVHLASRQPLVHSPSQF